MSLCRIEDVTEPISYDEALLRTCALLDHTGSIPDALQHMHQFKLCDAKGQKLGRQHMIAAGDTIHLHSQKGEPEVKERRVEIDPGGGSGRFVTYEFQPGADPLVLEVPLNRIGPNPLVVRSWACEQLGLVEHECCLKLDDATGNYVLKSTAFRHQQEQLHEKPRPTQQQYEVLKEVKEQQKQLQNLRKLYPLGPMHRQPPAFRVGAEMAPSAPAPVRVIFKSQDTGDVFPLALSTYEAQQARSEAFKQACVWLGISDGDHYLLDVDGANKPLVLGETILFKRRAHVPTGDFVRISGAPGYSQNTLYIACSPTGISEAHLRRAVATQLQIPESAFMLQMDMFALTKPWWTPQDEARYVAK